MSIDIFVYIFGIVAFIGLGLFYFRLSLKASKPIQCPKCGHNLNFHIRGEQNKDGLHYVHYWCTNCGYAIMLPLKED